MPQVKSINQLGQWNWDEKVYIIILKIQRTTKMVITIHSIFPVHVWCMLICHILNRNEKYNETLPKLKWNVEVSISKNKLSEYSKTSNCKIY